MKLIGAGLPRTATLSQKVGLEMLGLGPCYHMVNVLSDLDLVGQWQRALDGDAQWDEIFDGFAATVDWPGSFFYRELMEAYPDAKVLLSVRDGDAWTRSMRKTIWASLYGEDLIGHLAAARAQVDPQWRDYIELMTEMWRRSGLLAGAESGDDGMAAAMRRYHEEVQAAVDPDRLLVWSPADGWGSLCEFLQVAEPETPFPRLNDSHQFVERIIDGSLLAIQQWRAQDGQDAAVTQSSASDA
ncbi:MAG: sulfotransferase family protein [Solirubrobacteraceae bacterium]